MGAVQSDLKASIVQASTGGRVIPANDHDFWSIFWIRPETSEHVFETFTSTDIRGMRDDPVASDNLKTLIFKAALFIIKHRTLAHSLSEDHARTGLEILNCVRILTRVYPYIYESDNLRRWEESVVWQSQDASFYKKYGEKISDFFDVSQTLGSQLVNALLDLLFYSGFTLPWADSDSQFVKEGRVSYGLWQSGIACDVHVQSTWTYESKRTEIMQLLLTLDSRCIYVSPGEYIKLNVPAVDCMVRHSDKRRLQSVLCSLLNTIIKYHPETWLPFDPRNAQGSTNRQVYVKTCLHFLLVNLLNRAPWDDSGREKNEFRLQFSYLHKPKHFQFLADGIFKILRQPLELTNNVLSMGQRPVAWGAEMILLLWEALYTNRKFLHYIVESGRALDLLVLLIYYAKESQMEGIGRVCVFCMQTMSAEPSFGQMLNRTFEAHNALPQSIQIKNFHGKYSDYFISSILSLLEASTFESAYWSVSLTAILNNVAPEIVGLARATSSKIVQTFVRMSKPEFLFANDTNIVLLSNLLDAISTIIEYNTPEQANETLLFMVWRARKRFEALREISLFNEERLASIVLPSVSAPEARTPEQGDGQPSGEKSRGKQPFVQGNIPHEVIKRLPDLRLHTPLTLIQNINEGIQSSSSDNEQHTSATNSSRSSFTSIRTSSDKTLPDLIDMIRETGTAGVEQSSPTVEIFRFQPSIAALYASYYWGLVVSQDVQRASETGKGIWVGTNVRLFGIRSGHTQGPSLWSPRGAVDAVGESLIAGVKDLTLKARKGMSGEGDE